MAPHIEAKRKSHIRGLVFGFAQSMPFFAYAGKNDKFKGFPKTFLYKHNVKN